MTKENKVQKEGDIKVSRLVGLSLFSVAVVIIVVISWIVFFYIYEGVPGSSLEDGHFYAKEKVFVTDLGGSLGLLLEERSFETAVKRTRRLLIINREKIRNRNLQVLTAEEIPPNFFVKLMTIIPPEDPVEWRNEISVYVLIRVLNKTQPE